MDIENLITIEICEMIISELEKDILYNFYDFTYGSYKLSPYALNYSDYYIKKKDLGYFKVEAARSQPNSTGAVRCEDMFSIPIKKEPKTFKNWWYHLFHDKTKYEILIDKIYELLIERNAAEIRQKEYKKNEKLVDFLPVERRTQFLREQKLKRIIKEEL